MTEQMKFEVTVTSHDLLRRGVCEAESRFVCVAAEDTATGYFEARELAAQFVLAMEAIYGTGMDMVTNAYPIF